MTDETQVPGQEEAPKPDRHCSFCNKSQHEVRKLIASQGEACICDECAELCTDICREYTPPRTRAHQEVYIEPSTLDQMVVACAAGSTLAALGYEGSGSQITLKDIVDRLAEQALVRPRRVEDLKEQIAVGSADSDSARALLAQLEKEVEFALPPALVEPLE